MQNTARTAPATSPTSGQAGTQNKNAFPLPDFLKNANAASGQGAAQPPAGKATPAAGLSLLNSFGNIGNQGAAARPQPFAKNPQNFVPGQPPVAPMPMPTPAGKTGPAPAPSGAARGPAPGSGPHAGGVSPLAHIAGQVASNSETESGTVTMSGPDDGTDPGYPMPPSTTSKKEEDSAAAWALEPEPSQVDFYPPMLQCVAQMFKLYNKPVSANVIASRLPSGQVSHRPTAILRAAKAIGLESNIIAKATLEQISPLTLPAILMLQNENACILTEYDSENAKVIFPEQGAAVSIPREELDKEYIGYAVFAQLESQLDPRASKVKLLDTKKWFWGTLSGFLPIYKHVVSCSVIINVLALTGPLFFMNVYDKVLPNKLNAVETLWALAIGIFIAYIFDFALKNLRSYFVDLAGRNADIIIAGKLMQQVLNMRLDAKPESTGSLANNLREFESLRDFFSSSTMTVLVDIPFLFVFLAIIGYLGGALVIVPVAAIPIVVIIGIFMQFPMQNTAEKGFKENMQKNALLVELINGLETVKTSMAEGRMMNAWEKVVGMSALSNADSKRMANLSINASVMLTQLVSVGLIIVGVYRYSDGLITMGGIIASNMLAGRAMAPLSQLAGMFARLQQSRMALKALDQLMQLPIENVASDSYVDFGHLEHSLSVEELSFKYPNSERASLERINIAVKPGEKVGIIGAMGSGKSTFGRLCVGLYQPSEGAVKMGGVDIRQLDTTTLRSRIGYVSQDNYLFYGTVRENIAFGASNVDDRMILRAANIAGVTDFVRSNPAGFGMQVGERGMNLSGGQRQSVAIARALLRDPDILIMDEPSSNMDNYSENMLKHRFSATMGNKTVIIITHRLSMLDLVQRLVVMDQGHLYADGPKEKVLEFLKQEQNKTAAKRNVAPQTSVAGA
ncbi:MAG: type I secretion system permease/ATPase [Deltaproteobacteria bacterium]|nr:type I secretion system permease/ATPase [Deltaproteobacteria bacterium]